MSSVVGTVSGLQDSFKNIFVGANNDLNYAINRLETSLQDSIDSLKNDPDISDAEKFARLSRKVRKNSSMQDLKKQLKKL